jgi:hypothetical protein
MWKIFIEQPVYVPIKIIKQWNTLLKLWDKKKSTKQNCQPLDHKTTEINLNKIANLYTTKKHHDIR